MRLCFFFNRTNLWHTAIALAFLLHAVAGAGNAATLASDPGSLTVHDGPGEFNDVYVALGNVAELYVYATGNGVLHYQWFHNGAAIPGATSAAPTFRPTAVETGLLWVVVTDDLGTVESKHVQLIVRNDSARVDWKFRVYYPWSMPAIRPDGKIF
ncbi:MAG: hypothetical protein HY299_22400 [Verrucomicrobia bacterium]|nr:hypothetical protein [Verrucomicrobiota bacterium]